MTPPQTRQASGSQIDLFLVEAVVMNMVENLQASTSPLWKPRGSQIEPFLVEAVVMNMVENLLASPSPLWGLYGVYVLGRERRYLEAGVFSSSGGLVWRVRSRA